MGRGINLDLQLEPPVVAIHKMKLLTVEEEEAKHYICELSNSIMTDPVSMDGPHYYQRNELVQYIQDQGLSPVTYELATVDDIQEEPALKAELQRYLRDNPTRLNNNGGNQNQINLGQIQQTKFQQLQQQQFQSPQNQFIQPQQSPFNPALQSPFNQAGQMGRGINPDLQLELPVVAIPQMKLLTVEEEEAKHYICELSNSIMTDPVSMDGPHYYQRNELVAFIQDQRLSPVTFEPTTYNDIKEEPELKAELERYLRDNPTRLNNNGEKLALQNNMSLNWFIF
ncbi:MAG: hypothetical protein EZS28_029840 [Streblomastix strix]|uniref:U-box domain-containing protein n=1 Tax=Streblomastix strix TaxID=222440 RepID=A0A5J4UY13_9EUKA|nr:MAG: hypothetical protein EZS28_029840 [Streblomastix strix]